MVAVLTMGGRGVEVKVTLTNDISQVCHCFLVSGGTWL